VAPTLTLFFPHSSLTLSSRHGDGDGDGDGTLTLAAGVLKPATHHPLRCRPCSCTRAARAPELSSLLPAQRCAMAGQWTGSPMKQASMASSSTTSGKRECPYCHVPLDRIQSKQKNTKDVWFLVCPYNVKVSILDIFLTSLCLLMAL
jgi:hypothetical protein